MHLQRVRTPAFAALALSVALIAGTVVIVATPAGASPSWSIAPSPSPVGPPTGDLLSVSCASPASCFGVGDDYDGTPLIEHWNGAGWTVMADAALTPPQSGVSSVSCPNTTTCFAVGGSETVNALIERWDGTSWSIMTTPNLDGQGSYLTNVWCGTSTSCWAVGELPGGLIAHWDGTDWSIMTSPEPTGSMYNELTAVRCQSADSCFAVGDDFVNGAAETLIEHWDGIGWSVVPSPSPIGADNIQLNGVACPNTTICYAVGDTRGDSFVHTLVERWDGAHWTIMTSPSGPYRKLPARSVVHTGIELRRRRQ